MENDLSMKMIYYKKLKGFTNETLAEATGLPVGTISRIASGSVKAPTLKTLRAIAKAFECTIDDLQEDNIQPYYLNKETAEIAQEIYENKNLRILLDASKHLTPEDLKAVVEIAERLRSTNR